MSAEGYCQCGCGQWLGYWQENDATYGRVKGQPKRYARGHNNKVGVELTPQKYRAIWSEKRPHVPYGYCWCGCGQKTNIASRTSQALGSVNGEPRKYVRAHQRKNYPTRQPVYAVLNGEKIARIPLTQGREAIVDAEDAEWLAQWSWYCSEADGYARRNGKPEMQQDGRVRRLPVLMHCALLNVPDDRETDHRNMNRLDNRKANLRAATRGQNMSNKLASATHNGRAKSSKYKGVYWHKRQGKWAAAVSARGERTSLGYFGSEEAAARAYDAAALALHGKFARINFAVAEAS